MRAAAWSGPPHLARPARPAAAATIVPLTVGGPLRDGSAARPNPGLRAPERPYRPGLPRRPAGPSAVGPARPSAAATPATGLPVPSTVRSGASVSLVSRPGPDQVPDGRGQRLVGDARGADRVAAGAKRAPTRSASARKNSAPPPSRAASTASCSGVIVISPGSGNSSGAASAGASTSQPSPPGRPPAPDHTISPAAVARRAPRGSSRAPGRAAPASPAPRPRPRRPASCSIASYTASGPGPARPAAVGACRAGRVLPGGQEPRQRLRRHRLGLPAQLGQAAAAQQPEHPGVAPLGAAPAGQELALGHPALGGQPPQRAGDHRHAEAVPVRGRARGERPVRAGVPGHQVAQRVAERLGERGRARPAAAPPPARRAAFRRPRSPPSAARPPPGPRAPGAARPARRASPARPRGPRTAPRPPWPTAGRPRAAGPRPPPGHGTYGAARATGRRVRNPERCPGRAALSRRPGPAARRAARSRAPAPGPGARPGARRPRT